MRVRFTDDRGIAETVISAAVTVENTPATGVPELSGTARAGQTLSAGTGGIADPDGLTKAADGETGFAFSYRWIQVDGTEETEVGTEQSYGPLAGADVGKDIRVEVTFADDLGMAEGPLASVPATIQTAGRPSATCDAPDFAAAGRAESGPGTWRWGRVVPAMSDSTI